MHITALVDHPDHVCCRYRLAAFGSFFQQAGHDLEYKPLVRGWWQRLRQLHAHRSEITILQRRLLSGSGLRTLRRNTRHLIFDFDDAVWLRDSNSPKGLVSARRLVRFAATMTAADTVLAGNDFLAQHACRFADPAYVHVIPTCIDIGSYPLAKHEQCGTGVRLVWVGSSSTLRSLERFGAHLEEIGRNIPGIRLKLICDRFLSIQRLEVEPRTWDGATEACELAAADIGIAWTPNDDWSRGKCGLKVLQYMAAGLPVVANPVGIHCDMVRHGETGFLATTAAEWIAAVRAPAHDPDMRRGMGLAGRQLVESRYSVTRGSAAWLALLNGLARVRQAA